MAVFPLPTLLSLFAHAHNALPLGEVWVAYSEPPVSRICVVDCTIQNMTDTGITQLEGRVTSMETVGHEMVLVGTMSWFIHAFSQTSREQIWQQRVHDAVLTMQVYREDGDTMDSAMTISRSTTTAVGHPSGVNSQRLFAGLADGTVAVLENISMNSNSYDMFYLPIGQSPVTCIKLLGNQLWCACGNTISIIHASTLDPVDRFNVSANPYDTVLSLVPGLPGVWVSVRGSSVLELWDPTTLSCKMLYDTRTGRYPNLRKEDDTYFNAARITSILALDHSVWVGTGEGTLITFDVFAQAHKTPSDCSDYLTDAAIMPISLPVVEDAGKADVSAEWSSSEPRHDPDSYTRLLEVEKRVRDLYAQGMVTEPSEEDDVENNGRITAGNSASGYYSNSSNTCNDVVAGNVSGKACNGVVVGVATEGEGGCGSNNSTKSNQKLISPQGNGTRGDGGFPNSDLNTNHKSGGIDSVDNTSVTIGNRNNAVEKSNKARSEINQETALSESSRLALINNGQKDNGAPHSNTTNTKTSGIVAPSPIYIPPSLAMNRPRPVLTKADSFDSRRTSVISGSTDASGTSMTCDSGYVRTTSCRTSESSGAAANETPGVAGISKNTPETQSDRGNRASSSSAVSSKSGGSAEDTKSTRSPVASGSVCNGSGKSKKKSKTKKSSAAATATNGNSPPPQPDLYYLFRPDLSSEKKPKAEVAAPHCDGFDENKNRRCFCGTAGLDPLAGHINPEAKSSTNKEKFGQLVKPTPLKGIEGCANVSFLSQTVEDVPKTDIDQSEYSKVNVNQGIPAVDECRPEREEGASPPPMSPPPNSQNTSARSASIDSNKTTGSDDVFQNNCDVNNTADTIKCPTPNNSLSEMTVKSSEDFNDVTTHNDKDESQTNDSNTENMSKDCFEEEKIEKPISNGSAHINAKLELFKSNLDSAGMEAETKLMANKTLQFKSEHGGDAVIAYTRDDTPDDPLYSEGKVLNGEEIKNQNKKEQKPKSAFNLVKSLAAKFENAQGKRPASRPLETPKEKATLRRTASVGVSRHFGQSKVTSGRSGRIHHLSVNAFSDSDDEAGDRKNDSSYVLINHDDIDDNNSEISTKEKDLPISSVFENNEINNRKDVDQNKGSQSEKSSGFQTQSFDSDSPLPKNGNKTEYVSKEINCHTNPSNSDDHVENGKDEPVTSKTLVNGFKHENTESSAKNSTSCNNHVNNKQPQTNANNINNINNNRNFTSIKNNKNTTSSAADIINQKNNINSLNSLKLTKGLEDDQVQTKPSQPKLTNPSVAAAKIDTKFYGDSDEDTSVHEARVQSFKDTYKRISANPAKGKLGTVENSTMPLNEASYTEKGTAFTESGGRKERNMKLNFKNGSSPMRISSNFSPKTARGNQFETSSDSQTSPMASPKSGSSTRFGKVMSPQNMSATSASIGVRPNIPYPPGNNSSYTPKSNIPRNNSSNNFKTIASTNTEMNTHNGGVDASSSPAARVTAAATSACVSYSSRCGSLPTASSSSSISTVSSPGGRPTSLGRKFSDISSIHGNFRSRDPGARWRLDYTNIHVDTTDQESLAMSSVSRDGAEQEEDEAGDAAGDSRRLSCLSTGSEMKNIRLSQFLKDTAESFTSQFGYALEEEMVGIIIFDWGMRLERKLSFLLAKPSLKSIACGHERNFCALFSFLIGLY
ncbi:Ypt/rab gtpase activating protein [Elysia marginata]|uniref:Ypt/rab gtpase activating protein n=1 Tax=Elysia marginata TaxID=1093978 RepID=A0AAV4F4Q5_9GAST|nr:Ypt/rab gtpase activating protein [Elysia marginata]